MSKTLLAILISVAAAACGTTEAAPAPTAPAPASSTGDAQTACVEVMTRNRSCTTEFIPALVDARARHDTPPGIAEAVKADRDAVIAKAMTEWAEDSKDEALARTCQQLVEKAPADPADVDTGKGCLAQDDCGAYVACVMPLFEKHFTK